MGMFDMKMSDDYVETLGRFVVAPAVGRADRVELRSHLRGREIDGDAELVR